MGVIVTLLKSRKTPFVWGDADLSDLECISNEEIHLRLDKANLHFKQEGELISVLYGNCIMHFKSQSQNCFLEVEIIGNNKLHAISKLAKAMRLNAYSLDGDDVHECFDYVIGEWVCDLMNSSSK